MEVGPHGGGVGVVTIQLSLRAGRRWRAQVLVGWLAWLTLLIARSQCLVAELAAVRVGQSHAMITPCPRCNEHNTAPPAPMAHLPSNSLALLTGHVLRIVAY